MATAAPGTASSSGVVSWKNSFNNSQPHRLSSERSFRSNRKYLRSILGMLKIKWRCGTALMTSWQSHSPNSITRFWWQDEQKWRCLQENAKRYSCPQSSHLTLQIRYARYRNQDSDKSTFSHKIGERHIAFQSALYRPVQMIQNLKSFMKKIKTVHISLKPQEGFQYLRRIDQKDLSAYNVWKIRLYSRLSFSA